MDLQRIIETGDRSQTKQLIATAMRGDTSVELHDALAACADPRSVLPLKRLLLAPGSSEEQRALAGSLLLGRGLMPHDPKWIRAAWSEHGHPVRKHLISHYSHTLEPELLKILSDPEHPWLEQALAASAHAHASPDLIARWLLHLHHDEPTLRAEATRAVLYAEPWSVLPRLLDLLSDPHVEVVCEAATTLSWYPGVEVLLELRSSRDSWQQHLDDDPASAIAWDLLEVQIGARGTAAVEHTRAWLEPVWPGLQAEAEARPDEVARLEARWNGADEPAAPSPPQPPMLSPEELDELELLLEDPDVSPQHLREYLSRPSLRQLTKEQGDAWRSRLLEHEDKWVRFAAIRWLADAEDSEALASAAADTEPTVASYAMWHLSAMPADPAYGELAWQVLQREGVRSIHESAVATFAAHAADPVDRLVHLASQGAGDVRLAAISELGTRGGMQRLMPVFQTVDDSWDEAIAMLEASTAQGVSAGPVGDLWEVDHAGLRCALVGALRAGVVAAPAGS